MQIKHDSRLDRQITKKREKTLLSFLKPHQAHSLSAHCPLSVTQPVSILVCKYVLIYLLSALKSISVSLEEESSILKLFSVQHFFFTSIINKLLLI